MNGTISFADQCRKYGIKGASYYHWIDQLMNSSSVTFEYRAGERVRIAQDQGKKRASQVRYDEWCLNPYFKQSTKSITKRINVTSMG